MRSFFILSFVICHFFTFSQKVTLTPLSFKKDFTLEKISATNVLKDYTQFSESPFTKIPKGFTLSNSSVFYKFDTLNCSLFIKKREDVDSLIYYRDCEDGKFCWGEFDNEYWQDNQSNRPGFVSENYHNWRKGIASCCEYLPDSDTTAIFSSNEFVDFPDILAIDENIPFSLVKLRYVTNSEYKEFIHYATDSLFRRFIGLNDPGVYFKNFRSESDCDINYDVKFTRGEIISSPYLVEFYYPYYERYYFRKQLDTRKIVFDFIEYPRNTGLSWINCRACHFPLPVDYGCLTHDRINCEMHAIEFHFTDMLDGFQAFRNRVSDTDSIKLKNFYFESRLSKTTIYPDTLSWLKSNRGNTTSNYTIWGAENYFRLKEFENYPVQGVNYWQAKSFLAWKTKFHNRELMRQGASFRVLYTFPLPEEISLKQTIKIELPKFEFEKYIITNKEYEDFVVYVTDSICLREFSNHSQYPFEYVEYEYHGEHDEAENYNLDKRYFKKYFLMPRAKLEKQDEFPYMASLIIPEDSVEIFNYNGFDTRKLYYSFMWYNYDKDSLYQYLDLDLSYGYPRSRTHVYAHTDRSTFIIKDKINIFPGYDKIGYSRHVSGLVWKEIYEHFKECDTLGIKRFTPDSLDPNQPLFWEKNPRYFQKEDYSMQFKTYDFQSNPDAPITAITYEQAKAYYHWKNEVPYIPTKEEWNLIRQGINPYEEKELEVPGPFFRYVIRVYPVREED